MDVGKARAGGASHPPPGHIAEGGGAASAAALTGSGQGWTTSQIANAAITTAKVADAGVTTPKVGDGAVTEAELAAALANKLPKWAVVNTDGTLLRGTTGVTSLRISPGSYRVDFGQDISQCSWTGTQAVFNTAQLGNIGVQLDVTDDERTARTTDTGGTTADRVFSVQITC